MIPDCIKITLEDYKRTTPKCSKITLNDSIVPIYTAYPAQKYSADFIQACMMLIQNFYFKQHQHQIDIDWDTSILPSFVKIDDSDDDKTEIVITSRQDMEQAVDMLGLTQLYKLILNKEEIPEKAYEEDITNSKALVRELLTIKYLADSYPQMCKEWGD